MSTLTETLIESLAWNESEELAPFQPWARFFVRLGVRFGKITGGAPVTSAFALPTSDRSSTLVALGLVTELASKPIKVEANDERFRKLKELPGGHAVRVLRGGRLYVGEILSQSDLCNSSTIPILITQVTKDGKTTLRGQFLCTAENCMRVEPTLEESQAGQRQRGMRIIEHPEFVEAALDGGSVETLCLGSRLDYTIIGTRADIVHDADTGIGFRATGRKPVVGNASDLIRLKEGARDFRGVVISTTVREPRFPAARPHLAIFDGAPGYLKYRDRFDTSHQILLLDRSEPRFGEAVNQVNRDYINRLGEGPGGVCDGCPTGVEHITFTRS